MRYKTCELQYLETLSKRTELTATESAKLFALENGFKGELQLDLALQQAQLPPQLILTDLTLRYHQQVTQLDQLFCLGNTIYLSDAKNYQGHYLFSEHSWSHNGKKLPHNIFGQIDRAQDILGCILQENHLDLSVQTNIIFTNPAVQLEIVDPLAHSCQRIGAYRDYVADLVQQKLPLPQQSDMRWKKVLQAYQIPPYHLQHDFSRELSHRQLRPGICCPRCQHFDWQESFYCLTCQNCGAVETKEEAYVRTICDYGVLFFQHDLKLHDLMHFFGKQAKENYLLRMLRKHFTHRTSPGKKRSYQNKGAIFQYLFANQSQYFHHIQQRVNWTQRTQYKNE